MIRLPLTTTKLQVVLDGAPATNQSSCLVSYSDKSAAGYNGGLSVVATTGVTPADICDAPGANTVRDVDYLSLRNNDTAQIIASIIYNDNGTSHVIKKVTLAVGAMLCYVHGSGWQVVTATGELKTAASGIWGDITGTLANQTDLNAALAAKAANGANSDITSLTALTEGTPFRKNAVINGDFQVWQEGTSFVAAASDIYTAELWRYANNTSAVHTVSQSTDVPTIAEAGRKILYSLLIDCTTADASIAAGERVLIVNYIEGYNFVNIAGVGLCLQFWHKHTKTGTYCVGFKNIGNDRSFVREYTQSVSDTWEFASVLIDASPSAGTWNYTTNIGLQVVFVVTAGSTFQTAAGVWQTGNYYATSNQVNACDSTANNFRLAGVQLEKGSVATEFDVKSFDTVLKECRRYWRKSYAYGTALGALTRVNCAQLSSYSNTATTQNNGMSFSFGEPMRVSPTVTSYDPDAGTVNKGLYDAPSTPVTQGTISFASIGEHTIGSVSISTTGRTPGDPLGILFHWTANARF